MHGGVTGHRGMMKRLSLAAIESTGERKGIVDADVVMIDVVDINDERDVLIAPTDEGPYNDSGDGLDSKFLMTEAMCEGCAPERSRSDPTRAGRYNGQRSLKLWTGKWILMRL